MSHKTANLSARGAYVLAEATGKREVILIATGSEVSLAIKARDILQEKGIGTRVVSMPCMELFAAQDERYRRSVLPAGSAVRVGIEAGIRQGWDHGYWASVHGQIVLPLSACQVSEPLRQLVLYSNILE